MSDLADVTQLLRSADEEIRRQALSTLRGRDVAETCAVIFQAMADDSWRVRKDAVDLFVACEPDEQFIAGLLELLRNDENAGLRNSAVEALVKLRSRCSSLLVRMISDSDSDVRKFVVDVMGAIGDQVFLQPLLDALSDPDENVSSAAAEQLGQVGDKSVVPALIKSIIDNHSQFFRFSALTALSRLASHMPVPPEIIALADQDILRKGVFECLGSIADESASPVLLKGFTSRQRSCRRAAIVAWYRIYSHSSATVRLDLEETLRAMNSGDVMPVLIESFDTEEPQLAEAVTALLGIMGDLRGLTTLLEAYAHERLSGLALSSLKRLGNDGMKAMLEMYQQVGDISRCAICAVVGETACPQGREIISQALRDRSAMVRKTALTAAARLGMTECIPSIAGLLEEPDGEVRAAVLSCLQTMASFELESVQTVVRQLASSEIPEQRRYAAALGASIDCSEYLTLLVKDEHPAVREAAVVSLGKMGVASCSALLLMALVDEDPDVRIAAADALGQLGDRETLPQLIHALHDEDCWVQSAVLRSIVSIGQDQTFPVLRDTFAAADGLLMITCLEMLDRLGSDEALALVEKALDNCDSDVASLALDILSRQGGEWLEDNAERLLGHHRSDVRMTIAALVAELPPAVACVILSGALDREGDADVRERLQQLLDGLA